MTIYHDAADVLNREAKRYEALKGAADALNAIGSIEQAAAEAKARAKLHKDEADAAQVELTKIKANITKQKADLSARLEAEEADQVTSKRESAAAATTLKIRASTQAAEIITQANAKADAAIAIGEAKVQELKAAKVQLEDELVAINASIQSTTDAAQAAEGRLAKAQAAIAKLLG